MSFLLFRDCEARPVLLKQARPVDHLYGKLWRCDPLIRTHLREIKILRRRIDQLEDEEKEAHAVPATPPQPEAPPKKEARPEQPDTTRCRLCGAPVWKQLKLSALVCSQCGSTSRWYDTSFKAIDYSEEVDFASFSYRRENHFAEWIANSQAKETTLVNETILKQVMVVVHREFNITDPDLLTQNMVRNALKRFCLLYTSDAADE